MQAPTQVQVTSVTVRMKFTFGNLSSAYYSNILKIKIAIHSHSRLVLNRCYQLCNCMGNLKPS